MDSEWSLRELRNWQGSAFTTSLNVKPREKVIIVGAAQAFPLMHEIYKECLISDAYPMIFSDLGTEYTFYKYAKEHQLKHVPPFQKFLTENVDVRISIFCEPNPKALTNVDPSRIRMHRAARRGLVEISMKREAEGKYRWIGLPHPVTAQAQEAEMALPEYEDFVYSSCFVDGDDPTAEWKKIQKE